MEGNDEVLGALVFFFFRDAAVAVDRAPEGGRMLVADG